MAGSLTDPPKAHWPRVNTKKTHCLECARPIRRNQDGKWVHARHATAGNPQWRRAARSWWPGDAARAIQAWHQAKDDMMAARDRQDLAFEAMIKAGMLANHIAEATGLTRAGVAWMAQDRRLKLRRLPRATTPKATETVIDQMRRKGSVLFGD